MSVPSEPTLESVGDTLQSAASRLAIFVRDLAAKADEDNDSLFGDTRAVPYEIRMASIEARSAVDEWTTLRATAGKDGDDDT